jgi:hypothetical protein
MGFKGFYLSEAGHPNFVFPRGTIINNPITGEQISTDSADYDPGSEHSSNLTNLFHPKFGIKDKQQKGLPLGLPMPFWDRKSNHVFIVKAFNEKKVPSEYEQNKSMYDAKFQQWGVDPKFMDASGPTNRNNMKIMDKNGVSLDIFKPQIKQEYHTYEPQTRFEIGLVNNLKKSIADVHQRKGEDPGGDIASAKMQRD